MSREYRTHEEREQIATYVRKFYEGSLGDAEKVCLFLSIPIVDALTTTNRIHQLRGLAREMGPFLCMTNMEDVVYSVAFRESDATTRMYCLQSIAGMLGEVPSATKTRLCKEVKRRMKEIETLDVKLEEWEKVDLYEVKRLASVLGITRADGTKNASGAQRKERAAEP